MCLISALHTDPLMELWNPQLWWREGGRFLENLSTSTAPCPRGVPVCPRCGGELFGVDGAPSGDRIQIAIVRNWEYVLIRCGECRRGGLHCVVALSAACTEIWCLEHWGKWIGYGELLRSERAAYEFCRCAGVRIP